MDGTNVSVVWNKADETPRMTRNHVRWCEMNTLLSTLTSLSGTNWNRRKAGPKGVGHDCMDAGGRATPGAVAEEAQMSQVHGCTGATRRKL